MRKKLALILIAVLVLTLALAGCGTRDQETVMKDLGDLKQDLKSYEAKATMTVSANNTVQKYSIETWYLAPDYYRIALGNENKEVTQVIVRNQDGIFVVSPQLKKSFRFKGDWAEHQGYVYLYHSMLDRVMNSKDKDFDSKDGNLIFTMKMEPENPLVSKQRITLKDNLQPQQVALLDKDNKAVVSVDYESYKSGVSYKKEQFTPEAAMAMASQDAKPVMAGAKDFGVIEPRYVPTGAKMLDPQETKSSILLRYDGTSPFTITEQRPSARDTALRDGEMVDLWGTMAVVSGADGMDHHSMYWFHNNVEFSLTGKMAVDEMARIARSMITPSGK
jgi:outer membrane lipoprotein-sorting protein